LTEPEVFAAPPDWLEPESEVEPPVPDVAWPYAAVTLAANTGSTTTDRNAR
jgi:hypothetical protein